MSGRSRSSTGGEQSFKDPREHRRDEIERQGVADAQQVGMPLLTMVQTPPGQGGRDWYATRYS